MRKILSFGLLFFFIAASALGISIDDCSTNTNRVLSISIYDEDNISQAVTSTLELMGNYTNGSDEWNLNLTLTGSSTYYLCSDASDGKTLYLNAYALYTHNDVTNRYYFVNQSLDSALSGSEGDVNTTNTVQLTWGRTGNSDLQEHAQNFTAIHNMRIYKAGVRLGSSSNPSDWSSELFVARIETDNAGLPSGTLVSANATKSVLGSEINSNSGGWYYFEFPGTVDLQGNVTYHLVLRVDMINIANRWASILGDTSKTYTEGVAFNSTNGGAWTEQTTHDILFNMTWQYNATMSTKSIYILNDTESTSILKLTIRRESNYNYYPDVVTKLQRLDVGEGVYRTVQADKSDDFGLVTFDIYERSVDYRLIFLNENNEVLDTSTNLKFSCSNNLCELTYLIDDLEEPITTVNFSASITYNESTEIITLNWSDPIGDTHTVTSSFKRNTITGEMTVCTNTQTGSSGVVYCNVSGYNGEIFVTSDTNTQNIISQWIRMDTNTLYDVIGSEDATIITGILLVTIVGIGAASTTAILIASVIGLIIIYLIGLFNPITVGFIILAASMGIVIGMGVRRNR